MKEKLKSHYSSRITIDEFKERMGKFFEYATDEQISALYHMVTDIINYTIMEEKK